jgi:Pyruvate/2-oxoacid:ferredoxin oxidoreductase delta subunit
VFAGGDVVSLERSVTVSVGQGKRAARHIDAFLRGARRERPPRHALVSYSMLHLPVYSDAEPRTEPRAAVDDRLAGFEEVTSALEETQARYEAARCLSCGNCFECDGCYAACPEQAIERLGAGQGYRFRYDRCTGCAVCFETCPCHAIEMQPEPAAA